MTAFIRFFFVSICFALGAGEIVELQFIPNVIAEITAITECVKETKIDQVTVKSQNSQNILLDLTFNEEGGHFNIFAKFPFHLILTLNNVQFNENPLPRLEMAELKSLIGRPLRFSLLAREKPLKLDTDQTKVFGGYQCFQCGNFNGLLDADIHDIFLLAEIPLREGESHTFFKQLGPLPIAVVYTIKEISAEAILVSIDGKLDRSKLPLNSAQATAIGEIQGEICFERKNNLFFTSKQTGHFRYKFKEGNLESSVELTMNKQLISKAK